MSNSYSAGMIDINGDLWTWGYNGYGQLGNGSTNYDMTKIYLSNGRKWKSISFGYHHAIGIDMDGNMWGAGYGGHYSLGLGHASQYYTFIKLNTKKWHSVVCGYTHTLAIAEDGSLWVWGSGGNNNTGTNATYTTPYRIGNQNDWDKIAVGHYHNMMIKKDGTLWGFGYNGYGQLGTGNSNSRTSPTLISSEKWIDVSCGSNHTVAIKEDGTVWSAGYNNVGQLGIGHTSTRTSFNKVTSLPFPATQVSCGDVHTMILDSNSNVYCVGEGASHRLGNGSTANRSTFTKTNTSVKFKSISAGLSTSYAISHNNKPYAWGYAGHRQHFGSTSTYTVPTIAQNHASLGSILLLPESDTTISGLKSLFYFNGKYHRWNERVEEVKGTENAIPNMINNTSPYGVAYATDGNAFSAFNSNGSFWNANSNTGSPHYIQYRFDSPVAIDRISIKTGTISGTQTGLKNFEFYGSYDGTNFTLLYSGTQANNTSVQYHVINNDIKFTTYRLVGLNSFYTSKVYQIYIQQIEMFERPIQATPEHWEEVSFELPTKEVFDEKGQLTLTVSSQRIGFLPQEEAIAVKKYSDSTLHSTKISLKKQKYLDIESIHFETISRI